MYTFGAALFCRQRQFIYLLLLLDVLTPLSDSRQECVEKMERRISGVSCMCWMDFHNAIWCCGFLCARLSSVYFASLLVSFRLPRQGLPRPIYTARAITPLPPLHGYHACPFPGYHAIVLCSIPGLSHLSYHAPPHTYIGLSHPLLVIRIL